MNTICDIFLENETDTPRVSKKCPPIMSAERSEEMGADIMRFQKADLCLV